MVDRACEYDTPTVPEGRVVVVILTLRLAYADRGRQQSKQQNQRNFPAACLTIAVHGSTVARQRREHRARRSWLAGGDAGDADFALPPRNAIAAPPAATPPRIATIAIVRDEAWAPGSTFVCAIEIAAVRPATRRAHPNLKWSGDPVRVQPARHDLSAVVRSQGQAAAVVSKERAGTAGGQQESHYGPRDALVTRVLDADYRFFRTRRADVVDRAVAFQNNQVK